MTNMKWYNEPPAWSDENSILKVSTGAKTDFWRKTHYGFIRDDGHFYYTDISGDFKLRVKVSGEYRTEYDQAGLMIRENNNVWLKCGVEFMGGKKYASVVVTRDFSDWSIVELPDDAASLWVEIIRTGTAVEVKYSLDGENSSLMRLAYLSTSNEISAGLMCASPGDRGFNVVFEEYSFLPAAG